jgi:hypothetical protein
VTTGALVSGVGAGFDELSSEPPPQAVKLVAIINMLVLNASDNVSARAKFDEKNEHFGVLIGIRIQHPCLVNIKDHPWLCRAGKYHNFK